MSRVRIELKGSCLHEEMSLSRGDIVVVEIDRACNVMLMTNGNFAKYKRFDGHEYFGGYFRQSPAAIAVPDTGTWHLVMDLGGAGGHIEYSIRVIPAAS